MEKEEIDRLLQEGARHRRMTVASYRDFVQRITEKCSPVTFDQTLRIIAGFDDLERERKGVK